MSGAMTMRDSLRQMIALLQAERQALAGMDIDGIVGATADKRALCGTLDQSAAGVLDDECKALLDAARRLNEVNRQIRNLIAANVASRLDVLTGSTQLYCAKAGYGRIAAHR